MEAANETKYGTKVA